MGRPIVLLMDFAGRGSEWIAAAQTFCTVHRAKSEEELGTRIKLFCPHVLCFDFDSYTPAGLALLARTKASHPSLPILMITGEHSEALAIWALRSRVWDYFVKPVAIEELRRAIMTLAGAASGETVPAVPRRMWAHSAERGDALSGDRTRAEAAIVRARDYIARNLSRKLSAADIAENCAMSYFHFSRTFRRIAGMPFRDYVLRERILKAEQLLCQPRASITAVCFEVGFNDVSHFARMFRRYMGMSPSEYCHGITRGVLRLAVPPNEPH